MELRIKNWSFVETSNLTKFNCCNMTNTHIVNSLDIKDIPSLSVIPRMKKRRLSTFSQLALSTALDITIESDCVSVFSSRHGDLHKTNQLLKVVAGEEALSPTQFSLSVHNAVSGQFGILTNNKAASSVIAGGINSFHYALIEAYALLLENEEVLVVHTDTELPENYSQFEDELQVSHSLAILLSRIEGVPLQLTPIDTSGVISDPKLTPEKVLPQAIQFFNYLISDDTEIEISNKWKWSKTNDKN